MKIIKDTYYTSVVFCDKMMKNIFNQNPNMKMDFDIMDTSFLRFCTEINNYVNFSPLYCPAKAKPFQHAAQQRTPNEPVDKTGWGRAKKNPTKGVLIIDFIPEPDPLWVHSFANTCNA